MCISDQDLWRRAVADVEPLDGVARGVRRGGAADAGAPKTALRRDAVRVDARLDLHGLTLARAHDALAAFLAATPARRALIITGRSGELRRSVPLWLETPDLAARIADAAPAPAELGGRGALVVRLRRA